MVTEAEEAAPLLYQVMEELAETFESLSNLTDEAVEEPARSDERGQGTGGRLRAAQGLAGMPSMSPRRAWSSSRQTS